MVRLVFIAGLCSAAQGCMTIGRPAQIASITSDNPSTNSVPFVIEDSSGSSGKQLQTNTFAQIKRSPEISVTINEDDGQTQKISKGCTFDSAPFLANGYQLLQSPPAGLIIYPISLAIEAYNGEFWSCKELRIPGTQSKSPQLVDDERQDAVSRASMHGSPTPRNSEHCESVHALGFVAAEEHKLQVENLLSRKTGICFKLTQGLEYWTTPSIFQLDALSPAQIADLSSLTLSQMGLEFRSNFVLVADYGADPEDDFLSRPVQPRAFALVSLHNRAIVARFSDANANLTISKDKSKTESKDSNADFDSMNFSKRMLFRFAPNALILEPASGFPVALTHSKLNNAFIKRNTLDSGGTTIGSITHSQSVGQNTGRIDFGPTLIASKIKIGWRDSDINSSLAMLAGLLEGGYSYYTSYGVFLASSGLGFGRIQTRDQLENENTRYDAILKLSAAHRYDFGRFWYSQVGFDVRFFGEKLMLRSEGGAQGVLAFTSGIGAYFGRDYLRYAFD